MKLLHNKEEFELLRRQRWLSEEQHSRMTLLVGRRLFGKTSLISEAYSDRPFLYFKLSGKTEKRQFDEYKSQASRKLGLEFPSSVTNFTALMEFLFKVSEETPMTIVLEDFNELMKKTPDHNHLLQEQWKRIKKKSHVNLVLTISNPNHARLIFDDYGAPLLNTLDMKLYISPVSISTMKSHLDSTGKKWNNDDLLTFYMLSGACPKYVDYIVSNGAASKTEILDLMLRKESPLISDIKLFLTETLGHNAEAYRAILQLIACGYKSQHEIETMMGGSIIGGHLARLENEYCLIEKTRPLLVSEKSRNVVRYQIVDQFTEFWLRYLESNRDCLEIGDMDSLKTLVNNDFELYGKQVLRRYFIQKLHEESKLELIGGDWKSGRDPLFELDLVGLDHKNKMALIADVQMSSETFKRDPFLERVSALKKGSLRGYDVDTRLFTLNDM